LPWLKELRAQSVALRKLEHLPLSKVQGWCEVPRGIQLFESILVFEKQSLNTLLRAQGGAWLQREFWYTGQTNYPIRVSVFQEKELLLNIQYDRQRYDPVFVRNLLSYLGTLLGDIALDPNRRLSDFSLLTLTERDQILQEW